MNNSTANSTTYEQLRGRLTTECHTWLVTGVAGFIGSNLLEALLKLNQRVVGLDNFSTGHQRNLDEVQSLVSRAQWDNFRFVQGDICNLNDCREACAGVDHVLHQAALGSVPRSIENPINTNSANVSGFLNMLVAARDAKVSSFVYAASSSTYGDHPGMPKVEHTIGKPLSPYAVSKYVNELYAEVFARCYGFGTVGLRYFNVFGPRQDPNGAYAAVIPKWIKGILAGEEIFINGDGETSRDFCYIENAVQANLLAACERSDCAKGEVYNVAVGDRTSLKDLFEMIRKNLRAHDELFSNVEAIKRGFRAGDVLHSQADISKIRSYLGYAGEVKIAAGIAKTVHWYLEKQHAYRV